MLAFSSFCSYLYLKVPLRCFVAPRDGYIKKRYHLGIKTYDAYPREKNNQYVWKLLGKYRVCTCML